MSMPSEGDPAPEIALPDENGTIHRLSDRRGHWTIVYFYPKDDTPGCTIEACDFRDDHERIAAADAEVWGISPDGAASHEGFHAKFDLSFPLLSDEEHEVAEAYGAWTLRKRDGRDYMGIQRSTFLVDPDARIAQVWPKVQAEGHAAEVTAALAEATAERGERRP
jgi:peroxiredoxin Q/BCP